MPNNRSRISISERFQEITEYITENLPGFNNPYQDSLGEGGYEDPPSLEEILQRGAQLNNRDLTVAEIIDALREDFGQNNFNEPVTRQYIMERYDQILEDQIERSGPGAAHFGIHDPQHVDIIAEEIYTDLRGGGRRFGPSASTPCFPAGTSIALADGTIFNIESIEAGSVVAAFPEFSSDTTRGSSSPVTAALTPGKVVRTFNNVTEDWVEVHFTDPVTGEAKTLTATPGHVMLTPQGGYKQLIQMIDVGGEEPVLAGDRTDVQALGDYTGSVRLVLADSQIVTAQVWSVRYSETTAHLYEEAEMLVTRTEGGLAVQPEVKRGWKTYNFEVEKYHTYIAGGVRVHNMSENVHLAYGDTYFDTPDAVRNSLGGRLGVLYTCDHSGNIVSYDAETVSSSAVRSRAALYQLRTRMGCHAHVPSGSVYKPSAPSFSASS